MRTPKSRLRIPTIGHLKPAAREQFESLTWENDMSLSEGIARLVDWAIKNGKIPK